MLFRNFVSQKKSLSLKTNQCDFRFALTFQFQTSRLYYLNLIHVTNFILLRILKMYFIYKWTSIMKKRPGQSSHKTGNQPESLKRLINGL